MDQLQQRFTPYQLQLLFSLNFTTHRVIRFLLLELFLLSLHISPIDFLQKDTHLKLQLFCTFNSSHYAPAKSFRLS